MHVMQVHFWGDARNLTGSVEKVLRGFADLDSPEITLDIASCGEGAPEKIGRANYLFFQENGLRNRVLNKWLRQGAFTYQSLVKLIEARRPDILHFHNRQDLVDATVKGLSYRPRVLVHYHRNFYPYAVPRRADCLVAVSNSLRQDILDTVRPAIPVEVIHNPVPNGLLAAAGGPGERGDGPIRLLYGGGRQDHKGFFELEAALSSPGLAGKFEVVLCGPKLDGYQPPFPARVLGMLKQGDFMAQLRQADVVAMPSHREGFPLLVLEAMAYGKVLVTTQAGGISEIAHGENAILHEVGDQEGLAEALHTARELFEPDQERRLEQLKKSACETVSAFSTAAVTDHLANLYRKFA